MKYVEARRQGVFLAVLAGVIFGTAAIFTRLITGMSPIAIAAGRLLIGFAVMSLLVVGQQRGCELRQSVARLPLLLLLGLISSLHFLLFVLAVQKTLVANALILVNTAPILVLLLAPLLLHESITLLDGVSVGLTVTGAGIIVGVDKIAFRPEHLFGDVCGLGSALCYALYAILARKLRQQYSAPTIMMWFFGLGSVFLWIAGALRNDPLFAAPTPQSWVFLLLLGLLPTGIGHFAYNLSLKHIAVAKASTIVLLEPVSGTLFALLILAEVPPITSGVGILIALVGIGLASGVHHSTCTTKEQET